MGGPERVSDLLPLRLGLGSKGQLASCPVSVLVAQVLARVCAVARQLCVRRGVPSVRGSVRTSVAGSKIGEVSTLFSSGHLYSLNLRNERTSGLSLFLRHTRGSSYV